MNDHTEQSVGKYSIYIGGNVAHTGMQSEFTKFPGPGSIIETSAGGALTVERTLVYDGDWHIEVTQTSPPRAM